MSVPQNPLPAPTISRPTNPRRVVDASIAIKWYVPEVHDGAALRLLSGSYERLAPDLLPVEVGNILWKRVRRGETTPEQAHAVLQELAGAVTIRPSQTLMPLALEVALQTERTVYDSLYVALAMQENALLVTADEKFYNALRAGRLGSHVVWVENIVVENIVSVEDADLV